MITGKIVKVEVCQLGILSGAEKLSISILVVVGDTDALKVDRGTE